MTSTLHAAIIMDGNGRWAAARGLPRWVGHRHGASAVRRAVEAAPGLGVGTLTLYAFSSDNWRRPPEEVSAIFGLLEEYLSQEVENAIRNGVRLSVIGRKDRLSDALQERIGEAERRTMPCGRLHLRLAVDYSSRDMMLRAAESCARQGSWSRDAFLGALGGQDVDLLIRTGGEQRLSDFLLWESAYAELVFEPVLWPDFAGCHLARAVDGFRSRDRRFGGLSLREGVEARYSQV